jgi:hypothetical protein
MEFQFGELEQAIANFETILDTYPHKTTIWIIYVDQLVKQEKYETARFVTETYVIHFRFINVVLQGSSRTSGQPKVGGEGYEESFSKVYSF